jgi:hypothetical protein
MKVVGRIIARGEGIVGLFIPVQSDMYGIYEVREIMDELTVTRIGDPATPRARFTGLDLEGLLNDRPNSVATKNEIGLATIPNNIRPIVDFLVNLGYTHQANKYGMSLWVLNKCVIQICRDHAWVMPPPAGDLNLFEILEHDLHTGLEMWESMKVEYSDPALFDKLEQGHEYQPVSGS